MCYGAITIKRLVSKNATYDLQYVPPDKMVERVQRVAVSVRS